MADTKTEKQENLQDLVTEVPARMRVLKVMLYKGCNIIIRLIDEDVFEYLFIFDNQIYSDYIIMKPEEGKSKLNEKQINGTIGIIFTAATTTVDTLYQQKEEKMMSSSVKASKSKKALLN